MGSSFTGFRGKGFWSRDALLEAWLRVLALHMDDEAYRPGWQHELRDNWLLASAGHFSGFISASLDDLLTDGERIAVALRASERSLNSLRAFGDYVPATFLNGLGLKPFGADLPLTWFERIAECFNRLLRGELTTDAATSPMLPMARLGQNWDEIEQPREVKPTAARGGGSGVGKPPLPGTLLQEGGEGDKTKTSQPKGAPGVEGGRNS